MIRYLVPVAALMLAAAPAIAQQTSPTPSPAPTTPAPMTTAPGTSAPGSMSPGMSHRRHMSLDERFKTATTTNDGHLTLPQAQAGMPMVAKHFADIDKDKKGYVTVEQVHEYMKEMRKQRRANMQNDNSTTKQQ